MLFTEIDIQNQSSPGKDKGRLEGMADFSKVIMEKNEQLNQFKRSFIDTK